VRNFKAFIYLMRPANIMTSMADIFAGFFVAHTYTITTSHEFDFWIPLLWLLLSTTGLYGGGIIFNDVRDAELDRKERPERLIPSGIITRKQAAIFGLSLFAIGISAAYQVSFLSFYIAVIICFLTFFYNFYAKHFTYLGALIMGLCRSSNLILGASAAGELGNSLEIPLGILSASQLMFVAAITLISKKEVSTSFKASFWPSAILYILSIILTTFAIIHRGLEIMPSLALMVLFSYSIFKPLLKAMKKPHPLVVRQAVKAGILSLILSDAAIVTGFASWEYGVGVLGLIPLSYLFAKYCSVT